MSGAKDMYKLCIRISLMEGIDDTGEEVYSLFILGLTQNI